MEIRKYDGATSFGLTPRYSQKGDIARIAVAKIKPKATRAIDAAKDEFAKLTDEIKGDFCITDIITKTKDDFTVRFFIKEGDKPAFSDQFSFNTERDLIKKLGKPERDHKQKMKNKSNFNLQENLVGKFQSSYDANEEKLIAAQAKKQ